MKKILLLISIIVSSITILYGDVNNKKTIADMLTEQIVLDNNNCNFYTSTLLLLSLKISDKNEKILINKYNNEKDIRKKLFLAHIFVSRSIGQYEKEFIHLFPNVNDKNNVIETTYCSEYIHVISPLYDTLISLSYDNKEALSKLLNALKYADGAYADSLHSSADKIYKLNPKYVEKVSNENNISLKKLSIPSD